MADQKTPEQKLEDIKKKLGEIEKVIAKTDAKLKDLKIKKLELIEKADKIKAKKDK